MRSRRSHNLPNSCRNRGRQRGRAATLFIEGAKVVAGAKMASPTSGGEGAYRAVFLPRHATAFGEHSAERVATIYYVGIAGFAKEVYGARFVPHHAGHQ